MLKIYDIRGAAYGSSVLPVLAEADVAIAGAGPGGLGAALASAWCGAGTLVLEEYGMPGGMASIGEVHPFMINYGGGKLLDYPVFPRWQKQMEKYLPEKLLADIRNENDDSVRSINKEAAALAAEDLLLAAGVKMLYHYSVCGVQKDSAGMISGLICRTRGGFGLVKAKCFVDCTGDGNLAAVAGCPFEMGDAEGRCQPMSLCFKLSHVELPYVVNQYGGRVLDADWRRSLNQAYLQARQEGRIHCPRENVLVFPYRLEDDGTLHFNTTRITGLDATDGGDFSRAEIEGRRQLREILVWLREEVPGFEHARLLSMGTQIGVRESRRIRGLQYLTVEDFRNCSRFPEAIARCAYNIDIHSAKGAGTRIEAIPAGGFYEIPYGCTVPGNRINLTVGGRPISADVAVHSSLRIMPAAVSIGQGAGMGAALAALNGSRPDEISGSEVHEKLIEFGAHLD